MEVRFKNFRCFKDTDLLNLKKITLLVGENSSGKTSFLAGLNHISALLNEENIDLNSAPFEMGSFQDIYRKSKKGSDEQCFEYECKLDSLIYKWVFEDDQGEPKISRFKVTNLKDKSSIEFKPDDNVIFLEMELSNEEQNLFKLVGAKIVSGESKNSALKRLKFESNKEFSGWNIRRSSRFSIRNIFWAFDRGFIDGPRAGRFKHPTLLNLDDKDDKKYELSKHLVEKLYHSIHRWGRLGMDSIALAPLRNEPSRVYSFGQSKGGVNPDGSHVPDKLLRHSNATGRKKKDLEQNLQKFGKEAGLFKEISIRRLDKNSNYPFSIMVKTAQGEISNIMDVGYGVSQILPVIFEIISSGPDIQFLIQQPEVHLHPRAQAAFGSLMANLTKGNKRFIVETHSDFILDRLKYEIEQKNISNDDVGILFFDTEKSETKVWQIDLGKNGLPIDPPISYRKFFLDELDKVWS
jgi:AAA15 family ATPase/GTPase